MLEKLEEVRSAAAKISEGRLTIWNARLELAMRIGDPSRIDALLRHAPVADGSGCDCGCGGAMFRPGEQVTTPGEAR